MSIITPHNSNKTPNSQQNLVILGGGESGVGAAILGLKKGFDVFLSDAGSLSEKYTDKLNGLGVKYESGKHTLSEILKADLIIKSPGIPSNIPVIEQIKAAGIPVISEIEFARRYTNATTICITGSNGKTTTTLLTYHILKQAGLNVGLAGNIGNSFAEQVADRHFDYYVLELSSFMLDDMFAFKADIAVLLNITPDHLDRYEYNLDLYADSKMRIVQNQTANDAFIYCADDPEIEKSIYKHAPKSIKYPFSIQKTTDVTAWVEDEKLQINLTNLFTMSITDLALQGKHNLYNSMASGIVAKVLELRNETLRESMGNFKNVAHRLEHVARISGIDYINDSKATNVNATWYALESINTGIVLIMGGVDKGNDYTMMKDVVKERVKAIVCLGKDNKRIHEAFEEDVEIIVNTFSAFEAVQVAYHLAKKGDTVLLSPACASFDLFKNYEDRGDQFKAAVREL